jgi:uncharacterized protein (TIGR03067 family)
MGRNLFATCCIALLFAVRVFGDEADEKDLKALRGTWVVVAAEQDGKPLDRIKDGTLVVKDVNFHITTKGGTEMKGDLRLNASKKPRYMDLAHQEGLLRDKTWEAIYELDGDDLKICYAEVGSDKPRPEKFAAPKGSGLLFVTLKREKK